MIKFVSDLRQVDGTFRVLRFPPPIKLTATIIAEILLKATTNTLTLITTPYTFYSSSIYSSIINEEFEGTKGVIRIRISKKNRQHNCQKKKYKVQKGKQRSTKHTYKTEDRATRTPLKTGDELKCLGR